jgi:hypothetical protein
MSAFIPRPPEIPVAVVGKLDPIGLGRLARSEDMQKGDRNGVTSRH